MTPTPQTPLQLSAEQLRGLQERHSIREQTMKGKELTAAWNKDLGETLDKYGIPVLHPGEEVNT